VEIFTKHAFWIATQTNSDEYPYVFSEQGVLTVPVGQKEFTLFPIKCNFLLVAFHSRPLLCR